MIKLPVPVQQFQNGITRQTLAERIICKYALNRRNGRGVSLVWFIPRRLESSNPLRPHFLTQHWAVHYWWQMHSSGVHLELQTRIAHGSPAMQRVIRLLERVRIMSFVARGLELPSGLRIWCGFGPSGTVGWKTPSGVNPITESRCSQGNLPQLLLRITQDPRKMLVVSDGNPAGLKRKSETYLSQPGRMARQLDEIHPQPTVYLAPSGRMAGQLDGVRPQSKGYFAQSGRMAGQLDRDRLQPEAAPTVLGLGGTNNLPGRRIKVTPDWVERSNQVALVPVERRFAWQVPDTRLRKSALGELIRRQTLMFAPANDSPKLGRTWGWLWPSVDLAPQNRPALYQDLESVWRVALAKPDQFNRYLTFSNREFQKTERWQVTSAAEQRAQFPRQLRVAASGTGAWLQPGYGGEWRTLSVTRRVLLLGWNPASLQIFSAKLRGSAARDESGRRLTADVPNPHFGQAGRQFPALLNQLKWFGQLQRCVTPFPIGSSGVWQRSVTHFLERLALVNFAHNQKIAGVHHSSEVLRLAKPKVELQSFRHAEPGQGGLWPGNRLRTQIQTGGAVKRGTALSFVSEAAITEASTASSNQPGTVRELLRESLQTPELLQRFTLGVARSFHSELALQPQMQRTVILRLATEAGKQHQRGVRLEEQQRRTIRPNRAYAAPLPVLAAQASHQGFESPSAHRSTVPELRRSWSETAIFHHPPVLQPGAVERILRHARVDQGATATPTQRSSEFPAQKGEARSEIAPVGTVAPAHSFGEIAGLADTVWEMLERKIAIEKDRRGHW